MRWKISSAWLGKPRPDAQLRAVSRYKFDPISQKDYYAVALAGVNPGERDLRGMVNGEDAAELNALRMEEAHWLKAIERWKIPCANACSRPRRRPAPRSAAAQALGRVTPAAGLNDAHGKLPVT